MKMACNSCHKIWDRPKGSNRQNCYECKPMIRSSIPGVKPQHLSSIPGGISYVPVPPVDLGRSAETPEGQEKQPGLVETGVIEELSEFTSKVNKSDKASAIALARDVDSSATTGSQRAALVRQLRLLMAELRSNEPKPPSELDAWQDEIRARRQSAASAGDYL